jgi:hypothetical protein
METTTSKDGKTETKLTGKIETSATKDGAGGGDQTKNGDKPGRQKTAKRTTSGAIVKGGSEAQGNPTKSNQIKVAATKVHVPNKIKVTAPKVHVPTIHIK